MNMGCRNKMKKPFSSDAGVCVYVKSEKTAKKKYYIKKYERLVSVRKYKPLCLVWFRLVFA